MLGKNKTREANQIKEKEKMKKREKKIFFINKI